MKYSYNWLRELSSTEKSVEEVAELLTVHAFEIEGINDPAEDLKQVVVGHVVSLEKHPDADRLNVAMVDVGSDKHQIVCGGTNLAEGQKVPLALPGAVLPGNFEIKKSKIRGVESNGMICAIEEVNLGKGGDHEIMVLPEDAPIGEGFAAYMNLTDTVIEIDVLPNRAHDALSHEGMAREIAALEGRTVDFEKPLPVAANGVEIDLQTERCERLVGVTLENIQIGPSPEWLVQKLESLNQQSINNVVDITNYVMILTGQPLHAFDWAGATNGGKEKVLVRMAKDGEELAVLNGSHVTLTTEDIVIANESVALDVAGVIGGVPSATQDDSRSILLTGAKFSASSVRQTRARHKIDTDAGYRNERDLDPNLIDHALAIACELLVEHAGATVAAITDAYPDPVQSWSVSLELSEVKRLLGITLTAEEITKLLAPYNIVVSGVDGKLVCEIPTLRLDLRDSADIIEEIGRVYGYDKITPEPLTENVQAPEVNAERLFERRTKDALVSAGFDEVRSYSFYGASDASAVGLDPAQHVSLINPLTEEQELMRRTLSVGLLSASAKNASYFDGTRLFELGRFYNLQAGSLPEEKLMLGGAVTSKKSDGSQFYELKGALSSYLDSLGLTDYYFDDQFPDEISDALKLHPSRRAFVKSHDGTIFGVLGEIGKPLYKHFGLKKVRSAVMEVDLGILRELLDDHFDFSPLAKFPAVDRDLSLIVGDKERVADVERVLYDAGGKLLANIDLFDLYVNPKTTERSMAFHLIFSDPSRTLTSEEVDAVLEVMIQKAESELGAELKK